MKAELLTDVSPAEAIRLIKDPIFGCQEKFNGERRIIMKSDDSVWSLNRGGDPGKPLPAKLVDVLIRHPLSRFVVDGELVDDTLHIFDALVLGRELLGTKPYEHREARVHATFGRPMKLVRAVPTIRDTLDKHNFILDMMGKRSEGVVFKDMRKPYREGRAGQHFRLKFWKTADCVVIGPSPDGRNSVEIGLFDKGKLRRVSGCTIRGGIQPKRGDVLEVKYLYATSHGHIVQPTMLRNRVDKKAESCTIDQLVINKNFD